MTDIEKQIWTREGSGWKILQKISKVKNN